MTDHFVVAAFAAAAADDADLNTVDELATAVVVGMKNDPLAVVVMISLIHSFAVVFP